MRSLVLLVALMNLTSCGGLSWWGHKPTLQDRKIASVAAENYLNESPEAFSAGLDEKLNSLHIYYVLAQKNLNAFDENLKEMGHAELYESDDYLALVAIRTQVDEIEHELDEFWGNLSKETMNPLAEIKRGVFLERINAFANKSKMSFHSVENLIARLDVENKMIFKQQKAFYGRALELKEIVSEYQNLAARPQFQIYQKNIEHLAHVLSVKSDPGLPRFKPSAAKSGNITGNEFPAKVWALTFDDGPATKTSPVILQNLKKNGLRATFFQLTGNAKEMSKLAHEIRDAGMEIGSHSYSHAQLTKVSEESLDREIGQAVKDLEELQKLKIRFYRLPYGAGVNTPHVREKIAAQGLIHVYWNIDTLDWVSQTPEKLISRVKILMGKTSKDAGVLLFHDIHVRTTIATVEIMDYLKKDGRRVCTLGEIVTQMNEGVDTVCPQK